MFARKIFVMGLVFALALSGCASGGPGGEGTGAAVPTDPIGSVEENTPAPGAPLDTSAAPGAAATPQAVEAPFLATSIIGSEVAGQSGDYGMVEGIMLDASAGRGHYLVVRNIGPEVQKDVLLPWSAFQLVLLAPDQVAAGDSDAPVIWLTVEDSIASAAPQVDNDVLRDAEERSDDWDAEARQYWTGKVPEMPVTGGGDTSGGQNSLYLSQSVFEDIELPVRNAEGDAVGQLEEMVFNPDGMLAFGVVEIASLLDLGETQVVVPWKLLQWSGAERVFTLNATDEQLRGAPRFDAATLPDMTIPGWEQDWQRYWEGSGQQSPALTASAAGGQFQASHLMGRMVTDVNDALLGQVVDIILGQNGVDYLVIQAEDKLRPVPWADFEIGGAQEALLYLDDVQRYLDAPAFAALEQINAATPGWDEQIRGYWGLGTR